jgi:hypothetical protein
MDRAERMINSAIKAHEPFDGHRNSFAIYTKGSYANDTNVRLDTTSTSSSRTTPSSFHADYNQIQNPQPDPSFSPYTGPWTPDAWTAEVTKAISNYSGSSELDTSGEIAITVKEKPGSRGRPPGQSQGAREACGPRQGSPRRDAKVRLDSEPWHSRRQPGL